MDFENEIISIKDQVTYHVQRTRAELAALEYALTKLDQLAAAAAEARSK